MNSTTENEIVQELHSLELPWDDVLPREITEWLDIFSSAHNVVKEIMLPGILTALSGLMAPKTKLEMSAIELEPVNLFTIVLAPPGSGKSAALQAGVNGPILALEEHCDTPVLIEDFSKHGVFLHLKETEGVGVFARDEVHVFVESLLSSSKNKELDQDLLIKFFDNAPWTVNKGNTAKRDRTPHTALSFFGLSQPDSFLETYRKMAKKGNGLVDRILCCCPLPRRLTRSQLTEQVDRLQQCSIKNLNSMYEYVYHHHQDTVQPVVYTLSKDALDFFSKQEQQLVDAQNEIFSGKGDIGVARNISKAAKLMLRLGVALHVFIDRMTQALCQNGARDIPTVIEFESMQRAVALANWFLDSRYVLEKVSGLL